MTASKFATIHGGLLARKGEAAPAIRHDFGHVAYSDGPPPLPSADLMRPLPEPQVPLPVVGVVLGDAREPDPAVPAPCAAPQVEPRLRQACGRESPLRTGDGPAGRVSLRLTERQKRLVTIATAVLGRSQQKFLSDALDAHLARLGVGELRSCGCFRDHLRRDRDTAV